jgi:predicted Na+-dependent transporter
MSIYLAISLLFGMFLGQRFKVLILVPAILLMLIATSAISIARGDLSWTTVLPAAANLATLQIGYLIGLAIRHRLVAFPRNRLHPLAFLASASARRRAH